MTLFTAGNSVLKLKERLDNNGDDNNANKSNNLHETVSKGSILYLMCMDFSPSLPITRT